jgi:hypothetical protein
MWTYITDEIKGEVQNHRFSGYEIVDVSGDERGSSCNGVYKGKKGRFRRNFDWL